MDGQWKKSSMKKVQNKFSGLVKGNYLKTRARSLAFCTVVSFQRETPATRRFSAMFAKS